VSPPIGEQEKKLSSPYWLKIAGNHLNHSSLPPELAPWRVTLHSITAVMGTQQFTHR